MALVPTDSQTVGRILVQSSMWPMAAHNSSHDCWKWLFEAEPADVLSMPLQVRVMAARNLRGYVAYAKSLIEEKGHSSVVIRAMGRAIYKVVVIGEGLKDNLYGEHSSQLYPDYAAEHAISLCSSWGVQWDSAG